MNTIVHKTSVASRHKAETVDELAQILRDYGDAEMLDGVYVVEVLAEELSDSSVAYSLSIYRKETEQ